MADSGLVKYASHTYDLHRAFPPTRSSLFRQ